MISAPDAAWKDSGVSGASAPCFRSTLRRQGRIVSVAVVMAGLLSIFLGGGTGSEAMTRIAALGGIGRERGRVPGRLDRSVVIVFSLEA